MDTNKFMGAIDTKEIKYYGLNVLTHNPNTTRIGIKEIVYFMNGNMYAYKAGSDCDKLIFNTVFTFEGNELPTHWLEICKGENVVMIPVTNDQIEHIGMSMDPDVYAMAQTTMETMSNIDDLMDEDEDDETFEDFASVVEKNFK